jgi:hypothetical protein
MAELRDVSERFGDQRQPDLCSFFSARRLPYIKQGSEAVLTWIFLGF